MEVEFSAIANLALQKIGTSTGAGAIATLAIGVWYWLRAGTSDAILDRVRRIVAGKHEISHRGMKTYMALRRDREYFRYMCRVSVQSAFQLDRILAWIDRYDVGDDEVARCRFHIDPRSPEVLKPTPHWLTAILFAVFFASLAGTVSGAGFGLLLAGDN